MYPFSIVKNPNDESEVTHIKNILRYTLFIDIEKGIKEVNEHKGTDASKLDKIWEVCNEICGQYTVPKNYFGFNKGTTSNDYAFEQSALDKNFKNHCIFSTYLTLKNSSKSNKVSLRDLLDNHFDAYHLTYKKDTTYNIYKIEDLFKKNLELIKKHNLDEYIGLTEENDNFYISSNYHNFVINLIYQWKKCPYNVGSAEAYDTSMSKCHPKTISSFYEYFSEIGKKETPSLDDLSNYYIQERIFNSNLISKVAFSLEDIKQNYSDLFYNKIIKFLASYSLLPNVFSRVSFIDSIIKALKFDRIKDNSTIEQALELSKINVICYNIKDAGTATEKFTLWTTLINEFLSYAYLFSFPILEKCFFVLYYNCFGTQDSIAAEYIKTNISDYSIDTSWIETMKPIQKNYINTCYKHTYPLFGRCENIEVLYKADRFIPIPPPPTQKGNKADKDRDNTHLPEIIRYRNSYLAKHQQNIVDNLIQYDIEMRNSIEDYK